MSIKSEPQESIKCDGGDPEEGENSGRSVKDQYIEVMAQLKVGFDALLKDKLEKDDATLLYPITFEDLDDNEITVEKIVNPLEYAWPQNKEFIERSTPDDVKVLFVGINAAQSAPSGIPFGDEKKIKELFQIDISANKLKGIPSFPKDIQYADESGDPNGCPSGQWFWRFIEEDMTVEDSMDAFRRHCFVMNCSPLFFVGEQNNISLQKIQFSKNELLLSLMEKSQQALKEAIKFMKPNLIVALGRFPEKRVKEITVGLSMDIGVTYVENPISVVYDQGDYDEWIGKESLTSSRAKIRETIRRS